MKKHFLVIAFVTAAVLVAGNTSAQFNSTPPPPPPDVDDVVPTDVPIDGGLCVLLAAGVGYGVKRMKQHRK